MAGQQKSLPKQYGLIIPKKNVGFQRSTLLRTIPALFEDDSDIVDATAKSSSGTRKNNHDIKMKMETEALIHKTLTEDPTAFEYDTVFDRIQAEKAEQEGRARGRENDKNREPKYIQALQKASKEREKEFERRTERKVQREREAEGTEFAEKEAFVTSSYKKKMQEQQEAEAREREMDKVEAKLDVRKQDGLSIFYKHLLKQQTGEEKVKNADEAWSLSVKSGDVEGSRGTADRKRELSVEAESGKRQRGIGEHSQSPSRNSVDVLAVDAESARRSRSISIPGEMKAPPCPLDISVNETVPPISPVKKLSAAETKVLEFEKRAKVLAKRSTEDTALNARERYLARQAAKQVGSLSGFPV